MCLSKIFFPVFKFLFIFSLPLTFTLLAAPYWPLAFLIFLLWVPEVFLACGGNFRCWPKADTSSAVTIKT